MGESFKSVLALLLIVSAIVSSVVWWDDRPTSLVWCLRIVLPLIALSCVAALVGLTRRKDIAPDYLAEKARNYFNRDGFCFAIDVVPIDGVCYFYFYYQSQYSKRSQGRVAIRPAPGFWMTRPDFASICVDLSINPGEFGFVRLPVPVSKKLQGKSQAFEVGASVQYPDGKGTRLRFSDGIFLRTNEDFGDAFRTAIIVAGAVTGSIHYARPANTKVQLPANVAVELDGDAEIERESIWSFVSEED